MDAASGRRTVSAGKNAAEKRQTKDAVAVKENPNEQVKQFLFCASDRKSEAWNGKETLVDLNVKLKAATKRAKGVSYEKTVHSLAYNRLNSDRTKKVKD